jgi:hypothetical protein
MSLTIQKAGACLLWLGLITLATMFPPIGVASGVTTAVAMAQDRLADAPGTQVLHHVLLLAETTHQDAKTPSMEPANSGPVEGAAAAKKPAAKRQSAVKPTKQPNKVKKPKSSTPVRRATSKPGKVRQNKMATPPRHPTEAAGPELSMLVVGDSLAVGVGMTLERAFQGRGKVKIKKMGRISSGLDSPRSYDWNTVLKGELARERVDVLVIMLGANDAHNGPGTAAWGRLYEAKFAALLSIPAEKQVRTLVLALPPMRKTDFCQRVKVTNEAIKAASQRFPNNCIYIDSFSLFSDAGGNFTDHIRLKGELKQVRAGDGVHFTGTGYLVLSQMVADEALRHAGASSQSGDTTLREPNPAIPPDAP